MTLKKLGIFLIILIFALVGCQTTGPAKKVDSAKGFETFDVTNDEGIEKIYGIK